MPNSRGTPVYLPNATTLARLTGVPSCTELLNNICQIWKNCDSALWRMKFTTAGSWTIMEKQIYFGNCIFIEFTNQIIILIVNLYLRRFAVACLEWKRQRGKVRASVTQFRDAFTHFTPAQYPHRTVRISVPFCDKWVMWEVFTSKTLPYQVILSWRIGWSWVFIYPSKMEEDWTLNLGCIIYQRSMFSKTLFRSTLGIAKE